MNKKIEFFLCLFIQGSNNFSWNKKNINAILSYSKNTEKLLGCILFNTFRKFLGKTPVTDAAICKAENHNLQRY